MFESRIFSVKLIKNKNEISFRTISRTTEDQFIIHSFSNESHFKIMFETSIKSIVNKNLKYMGATLQDKILIIFHNNKLCFIDGDFQNKSLEEDFIAIQNLIDGQQKLFYQIENTNSLIGVNKFNQITHVSYSNYTKEVTVVVNKNIKFQKIGLFKHILYGFCEDCNELYVYNLDLGMKINNVFGIIIFKRFFNELKYACISNDCEYLSTFEDNRVLSVFRFQDHQRIAHVQIYSEINSILMSETFVVMSMQDNRILAYLLVDFLKPEHQNRISELDSR